MLVYKCQLIQVFLFILHECEIRETLYMCCAFSYARAIIWCHRLSNIHSAEKKLRFSPRTFFKGLVSGGIFQKKALQKNAESTDKQAFKSTLNILLLTVEGKNFTSL